MHRVTSDEAWHFYEGDPIELAITDRGFTNAETVTLGRFDGSARPVHVVPAGMWQAARPLGEYALAGCSVAPGFDFADFRMPPRSELVAAYPEHAALIASLTR